MKKDDLLELAKQDNTKDSRMLVVLLENDQPKSSIIHYLELKADLDVRLRKQGYDGQID